MNIRKKGAAGELEFCHRFNPFFPNTELKRNLNQTREGGADVEGCSPFVIEIKRCEKLEHKKWWRQVKAAVTHPEDIPTVAFRQNKKPWRFLIPSSLTGIDDDGFMEVDEDIWLKLVMHVFQDIPPF